MNWKEFLKPTKWTIGIFIILVILSYLLFGSFKIFPCEVQSVPPTPTEPKESICNLGFYVGVSVNITPVGYLMIILIVLILPYLIASLINFYIKK